MESRRIGLRQRCGLATSTFVNSDSPSFSTSAPSAFAGLIVMMVQLVSKVFMFIHTAVSQHLSKQVTLTCL